MGNIIIPKMFGQQPSGPFAKGLVFYWRGIPAGNVVDESPYGNNGTITGPTWVGDGLDFDGSNSWVDLGTDIDVFDLVNTTRNTITVATWIFPRTDGVRFIASNGDNISGTFRYNQWFFSVYTTSNIAFGVGDGTTQNFIITASNSIVLNKWNYVVGTINPDKLMRIYINGVLQSGESTFSVTPYSAQKETSITKNRGSGTFDGIISDVAIYNRALSASEIQQLYLNSNLPMQQPPIWLFTSPVVGVTMAAHYYRHLMQGVA